MLKLSTAKFDINSYPPGIWHVYPSAKDVRIKIRKITNDVLAGFRKKYTMTEMQADPQTGKMMPVVTEDEAALNAAFTEYLIEDFEGIVDESDKLLDASPENKKHLANNIDLSKWIWEKATQLEHVSQAQFEEEGKNFDTSPQCG